MNGRPGGCRVDELRTCLKLVNRGSFLHSACVNWLLLSAFAAFGSAGATTAPGPLAVAAQPAPATIPEMWTAWCARCHAEDGSGTIDEPTVTVQPMDFTDCRVATPEPDADWARAIAKGGPGVGLSPQMPAFEDSLTPEQIAAFVSHLRGFCREPGWPIGNTNFPRPLRTAKAFPENELVILPAVSHFDERPAPSITEASLTAVYERRVGKRSMVEISLPLLATNSLTAWTSGIGDAAVAVKHALFASASRIVSAGVEAVLPTGDRFDDHGHGTVIVEPFISAGALMGNWYLQTELKAAFPRDRERADRALIYNAYAGRDTSAAPDTWTVGVELNGEVENHLFGVTTHTMALLPQVRKGLTGTGALAAAAGVAVPLNRRDAQGVKWFGYLLWEYLEPLRAKQ